MCKWYKNVLRNAVSNLLYTEDWPGSIAKKKEKTALYLSEQETKVLHKQTRKRALIHRRNWKHSRKMLGPEIFMIFFLKYWGRHNVHIT
jgi:hypothetical protein